MHFFAARDTFTYDRLGRQKIITDAVGSRVFGYNSQLQQETETITGLYNKVITRTYETAGVTGRATGFNLGAGYAVTYGYEAGTGRFRSVDWSAGGQTGNAVYGYLNNSDLIEQLTINNSLLTKYTYEPNRNLKTQVKNEFNVRLISQYDYTYNNIGLRGNVNTSGEAFAGIPIEPTAETNTYNTNSLNQYTQIIKDKGQQTTDALTYDDDGNLTSIASTGSTKNYKYNAENRLISVEPATPVNGDKKVEFVYDYMGRRVQKKVYSYTSSAFSLQSIHLFVYNGWNLIEEQVSGIHNPVSRYYVWGLDLSQSLEGAGGVGGLLSVVDSGETYHYLYDSNGNVGQLVKTSDGSISAHYEYNPFGILLESSGVLANENPFRFSTKYYDNETDLCYYGYRYYSPELGRWINRDPSGEEGGINLYSFIRNDPINSWDYLGLIKYHFKEGRCKIYITLTWSIHFKDDSTGSWTLNQKQQWQKKAENIIENYFNNSPYKCYSCNNSCCVCPNGVEPVINLRYKWWLTFWRKKDFDVDIMFDLNHGSWVRGSGTAEFDRGDINPQQKGASTPQVPIIHETGHMFGMPHPGQRLTPPATLNSFPDYNADIDSLMGAGMTLRLIDFKEAFCDHIKTKNKTCNPWIGR